MKIAIVTAMWKRPEIFEMYAQGIHNLKPKHSLQVYTVGSEGAKSKELSHKYGFKYIEYDNKNLSNKHNAACMAARAFRPDYLLFLGSDDILSPETYSYLESVMEQGIDFIGMTDFYFYDTSTNKSAYWGGYIDKRRGHTVGAGRVVSARLMQKWQWRPFEQRHAKVLDDSMQQKLTGLNCRKHIFSLKDNGLFAVDVKSSTNMTPFQLWENTKFINNSELKSQFPWMMTETKLAPSHS